jgi:hypothetical protein
MDITNTYELRLIGLQRSGHHAILNWIVANIDGRYCFLNHCRPISNPFDESSIRRNRKIKLVTNIQDLDVSAESSGVHCRKDFLLYNYEERDLRDIENESFYANHDQWLGRSGTIHNVLILRDPFNNLASKLKMEDNRRSLKKVPTSLRHLPPSEIVRILSQPSRLAQKVVKRLRTRDKREGGAFRLAERSKEIFKAYAREYLGETNILSNKITVSYNRWFTDPEYRVSLGKRLHLASTDMGLDRVSNWGSGSSFDHAALDGKARDMDVLERWKTLIDDERYRRLINDPELCSLSERIFGGVIDLSSLAGR